MAYEVERARRELLRKSLGREDGTLVEVLRARAEASPDAALFLDGQRRVSSGMALDEAERIAYLLAKERGRGAGDRGQPGAVASFLPNCIDEHLWRLGANVAGRVHVSLNRHYRGDMLRDVLRRSGADWLVTDSAAWPVLGDVLWGTSIEAVVFLDGVPPDFPPAGPLTALDGSAWRDLPRHGGVPCAPTDCASMLFTSGTSGRPKAARLPHNMFVRGAAYLAAAWQLGPRDVFHDWSPAYHVSGQLYQFAAALVAGASCAVFPSFSRTRFWDQVDRFGCTYTGGFSNLATYLLSLPPSQDDTRHALRTIVLAAVAPEVCVAFEQRFNVRCVDGYGMTEAEPLACSIPGRSPAGSCGPINPDFAVRLVDEHGCEVAPGEAGRVLIKALRAGTMMSGYADDAAEAGSAEAGDAPRADGWFATHDLARLDAEGNFWFMSRERFALKRRGENVSPREVEFALRACRGVKDCTVLGVWEAGKQEPELKVIVVAHSAHRLDPGVIEAHCEAQLPKYMRPRYIEFVAELRYTETGKLQAAGLESLGPQVWDAALRRYLGDAAK